LESKRNNERKAVVVWRGVATISLALREKRIHCRRPDHVGATREIAFCVESTLGWYWARPPSKSEESDNEVKRKKSRTEEGKQTNIVRTFIIMMTNIFCGSTPACSAWVVRRNRTKSEIHPMIRTRTTYRVLVHARRNNPRSGGTSKKVPEFFY